MNEKGLGSRLQAARKAVGMTQQTLCHKANLSYSTLAKIERGAIKSPSIFTVQSIAAALGVDLGNLLGDVFPAPETRKLLKTKSGVGFVYFDVNGCLVQFFHRAFARLADQTGNPADLIETAFWHFNDEVCRGNMSLNDFNTALATRLGIDELDWQQFYLDAAEPVSAMHELLKWTAEHYRVGLLTNIMPGFLTVMRQRGQIPDIAYDAIVDSSEVGAIKPEPKVYEIAEQLAGVPVAEILLIDDSRTNLTAAEKAGWKVMWFDAYNAEESVSRIREALEPVTA